MRFAINIIIGAAVTLGILCLMSSLDSTPHKPAKEQASQRIAEAKGEWHRRQLSSHTEYFNRMLHPIAQAEVRK